MKAIRSCLTSRIVLRAFVLLCVALVYPVGVAGPAAAADVHFLQASRTVAQPQFVSARNLDGIVWVADVTFKFRVAGVPAHRGVTVSANIGKASVSAVAVCDASPQPATAVAIAINVSQPAVWRSNAKGVVEGTIVMRRSIAVAIVRPGFSPTCGVAVRVQYRDITLTAGGTTTELCPFNRVYSGGTVDLSLLGGPSRT
jgi:hypothetical protein